jgi:hypothetical protein
MLGSNTLPVGVERETQKIVSMNNKWLPGRLPARHILSTAGPLVLMCFKSNAPESLRQSGVDLCST